MTTSQQAADRFLASLQKEAETFNELLSMENGDWIVKGFIDVFKNVYTISGDTKVVSKLIELMLFPYFLKFAAREGFKLVLSREQNHYPDLTFIDEEGFKFALDLKSTYRTGPDRVSTMTLGAFTGYFRMRSSRKNITFPYEEYSAHCVLGVIYTKADVKPDELKICSINELKEIPSVVRNLQFFAQPKYCIASFRPGSGNTKNIGAISNVSELINGEGPFADLGEDVFDDYWTYYLTKDMARNVELDRPPYNNLESYFSYKKMP